MKKLLYKLVNKLGYRIENKKRELELLKEPLKKFSVKEHYWLLFQSKYYIKNLEQKFNTLTIKDYKEGLLIQFLDLSFYIESVEEFHILNEVFVRGDYDFISSDKSILIDIGANIGITSLYFSRYDFIEKIYGFEPVKDTFDQANINFNLNCKLHKVENFKNIGLGSSNKTEIFLFDKSCKGNTGVRGSKSASYLNNTHATERMVQIKEASIEIKSILNDNSDKKIVVKIDCEGAEYEIMDNLFKTGIINEIDVFLLEWHDRGSQFIEDILVNSNFDYFTTRFDSFSGMIYAFRNKTTRPF